MTLSRGLGDVYKRQPKDFATKLQAGTGASHIKSFIRYLKNFEFEKPLRDHAPNQRLIYEPKG